MGIENERAWYIIQTYSGLEIVAKRNLEQRIKSMNMDNLIFDVLVPEVREMEKNKKGELKEVIKKPYPGYVFIDMIYTPESWFMVRNTPMVTGFLGSSGGGAKPVPLHEDEINPILKMCGIQINRDFGLEVGDECNVTGGTFTGYTGKVDSIDFDREIVKVLINVFGRQTAVELDFSEVSKKEE